MVPSRLQEYRRLMAAAWWRKPARLLASNLRWRGRRAMEARVRRACLAAAACLCQRAASYPAARRCMGKHVRPAGEAKQERTCLAEVDQLVARTCAVEVDQVARMKA